MEKLITVGFKENGKAIAEIEGDVTPREIKAAQIAIIFAYRLKKRNDRKVEEISKVEVPEYYSAKAKKEEEE